MAEDRIEQYRAQNSASRLRLAVLGIAATAYGLAYLTAVAAVGYLYGFKPATILAIAAMGASYLSFMAQILSEKARVIPIMLAALSIVFGAAAGVDLIFVWLAPL